MSDTTETLIDDRPLTLSPADSPPLPLPLPSIRLRLRQWIATEIEGVAEVELPELARRALKTVLADPDALEAAVRDLLQPLVYEQVQQVVASTRGVPPWETDPSSVTRTETLTRPVRRGRRTWTHWLEHAGARHVLLLEMTARDLELAEVERRKRGAIETGLADLWRELRVKMGPEQKVKDVWTVEEIEAVRQRLSTRGPATP